MSLTKPLLTFIVPAYNVGKYLAECLDSLLNQTVKDHQVIVVNDGSTDHTKEIAQRYAAQYPEMIRYVEQENQGLGAARNTGLAMADTQYVTFLDSDDWQDCLFMEKLKRELNRQEEKPDIVFTLPWIYDAVTHQVLAWYDKQLLEQLFYPNGGDENVPSHVVNVKMERGLELYKLEASSCRRVYLTEFLKRIRFQFPIGVKWEDVQPHFNALHHARRCIAVKGTGFFYRVNTGGQITSGSGSSRLDLVPVFRNTLNMAIQEGWPEAEIAYIIRMLWGFTTWSVSVTNSEVIGPLLADMHNFYRSVPSRYFRKYCCMCSISQRRDRVIIALLRSPFYRLLEDYRTRKRAWEFLGRMNRVRRFLGRR